MVRLNSLRDVEAGEAMGELCLFYLLFCQGISRACHVLRPMMMASTLPCEREYLNDFEIHACTASDLYEEKRGSKRRKIRCGGCPEREQT